MGVQTCPVYLKANPLANTIRFTLNFNLGSFAAREKTPEPAAPAPSAGKEVAPAR